MDKKNLNKIADNILKANEDIWKAIIMAQSIIQDDFSELDLLNDKDRKDANEYLREKLKDMDVASISDYLLYFEDYKMIIDDSFKTKL